MGKKLNRIKLKTGTVFQKEEGGTYYFRYQVNHERKCVSLKTKNQEQALKEAESYLPIIAATSEEVIAAHVKVARKIADQAKILRLKDAWKTYSEHPDRATPATKHEELSYEASFQEFVNFMDKPELELRMITPKDAENFSSYLKTTSIAVTTHNRKIKRIRKIFATLKEFVTENPFSSPSLSRKTREEQNLPVRRIAFTREEEQQILDTLEDPKLRVMNREELRVIFHIGIFSGQRLKDCVLLCWDKIDLKNRRIWVKQFKTGKEVVIPIAEPLLKVLQEALKWKINPYVCPKVAERYKKVDERGKSIGDNFVNIDIMRVIRAAGFETSQAVEGRKRKVTVYGFHSLRHSFASFCAEAGIPKAVVVSILGANSAIIDQFYTHVGEEAQLKAIEAVTGVSGQQEKSAQERIHEVLQYINSIKELSPELLAVKKILQS